VEHIMDFANDMCKWMMAEDKDRASKKGA
jgi:hypothetical protein